MTKAIFFDAAGTLIRLTKSVGQHYALVGEQQGLMLDSAGLDRAFGQVWREMPMRPATGQPRPDDDKGWWRELGDTLLVAGNAAVARAQSVTGNVREIVTNALATH